MYVCLSVIYLMIIVRIFFAISKKVLTKYGYFEQKFNFLQTSSDGWSFHKTQNSQRLPIDNLTKKSQTSKKVVVNHWKLMKNKLNYDSKSNMSRGQSYSFIGSVGKPAHYHRFSKIGFFFLSIYDKIFSKIREP